MSAPTQARPLAARLWVYQRERFPLVKQGALIAVLAASSVCVSANLRGAAPSAAAIACATFVLFGLFLQLRVADEHKDLADDRRFRPERPVPRGLVTLAELRAVAAAVAAGQITATLWLHPPLLAVLLAIWAWMAAMTAEFFAHAWLRARPAVYLASHMAILPLIVLYALAADALPAGAWMAPGSLAALLALAFCNGAALEIARKSWAPEQERKGVETYSRLWGARRAAWAIGVALAGGYAAATLVQLRLPAAPGWALVPPLLACAAALLACVAYARSSTARTSARLETMAGLWVLVSYASLGLGPALWSAAR